MRFVYILGGIFTLFLILFGGAHVVKAADVDVDWIIQFGDIDSSSFIIEDVAAAEGNVYIAGHTEGTLSGEISAGGSDAFIVKYDVVGNLLWADQFGSAVFDGAFGLAIDSSGIYVAGMTEGTLPGETSLGDWDAFIRKYDQAGNVLWTRQFGTALFDGAFGVAADSSGVYVVGDTEGTLPGEISAGGWDGFIRKYDPDGNELWTNHIGTSGFDETFDVVVDTTGVYVSGTTFDAFSGQTNSGSADAYIRKYDLNGILLWTDQFGSSSSDEVFAMAGDNTGIYLIGVTFGALLGQTSAGGRDAYIRKYDLNGILLWTDQFGTEKFEDALGVAVASTGIYIVGTTTGTFPLQTNLGFRDAYIRKYTSGGTFVWTHQFGSSENDEVFGILVNSSSIYVGGSTAGVLPGQIGSGGPDAFVIKFIQDADGDGISDAIDMQPSVFSDDFSDGITAGTITSRGSQISTITDALDSTSGVFVATDPSGSGAPLKITACGGASKFSLGAGQTVTITCGSVGAQSLKGELNISFFAQDNFFAEVIIPERNGIIFEPETLSFFAFYDNKEPVTISIKGENFILQAGETGSYVQVEINPYAASSCLNSASKGVVSLAIFGSAGLDVSQIDLKTIDFGGLRTKEAGKSSRMLSSITNIDQDEYTDLSVYLDRKDQIDTNTEIFRFSASLLPQYGQGFLWGVSSVCITP